MHSPNNHSDVHQISSVCLHEVDVDVISVKSITVVRIFNLKPRSDERGRV